MATGSSNDMNINHVPYTGKYMALSDGFKTVQASKRARRSTGSTGGGDIETPLANDIDSLKQLPMDEKLNVLLEGMQNLHLIQSRIDNVERYVYFNSASTVVNDQRIRLLEYKQMDIEARQREVNLIFSGCPEKEGEWPESTVEFVLGTKMNLDKNFNIVRAFRMGRYRKQKPSVTGQPPPNPKPRSILATFSDVRQVHFILSKAKILKDTGISISRDYPTEIAEARKQLWPEFKAQRSKHGAENVKLTFPAAIIVNKVEHINLFPDWYPMLSKLRVTNVNERIANTLKDQSDMLARSMNHPLFQNTNSTTSQQPSFVQENIAGNKSDNTNVKQVFSPNKQHTASIDVHTQDEQRRSRSLTRRVSVPRRQLSPITFHARSPSIQQIRNQYNGNVDQDTSQTAQPNTVT